MKTIEAEIHCKFDKLIPPAQLKDHPKNRNKHGQDQIDRLADIFKYQGIRHPIIVSKLSGFIVAGHGRKLAAILAGIKEFPVVYQDFENIDKEYAFLISDNAIALWAELDFSEINLDLKDLVPNLDIKMLGINSFGMENFKLDYFEKESQNDVTEGYTDKIKTPIYEPKGECPSIKEIYDLTKTKELITKIENSDIDKDIKKFLIFSAYRHIMFNYEYIAEYYTHASKEVQELMEDSALVIIDYNKAIENGFVKLKKEINESLLNDPEEDSEEGV